MNETVEIEHSEPMATELNCTDTLRFDGDGWDGGSNGKVFLTFPEGSSSWKIQLEMDGDINRVLFWSAKEELVNSRTIVIENENWNGNNKAGTTLQLGFQMLFDKGNPRPNFVSITDESNTQLCGKRISNRH